MDTKTLPAILMSLLTFVCVLLVITGLNATLKRMNWHEAKRRAYMLKAIIIIGAWVLLVSVLSINGFFLDFASLPPRPALAIFLPMPFVFWFAFSKNGSTILRAIPPSWIVYLQSFRIAVEIMLWFAFVRNLLPIQMTFEGYNYDIFSGLLAIPTGWMLAEQTKRSRTVGVLYNIIGLLLLLNILCIAVLSMPTPLRRFMNEPSNTIVGEFPFIFLPAVLVVLAYGLHILSLRQIWLMRKRALII